MRFFFFLFCSISFCGVHAQFVTDFNLNSSIKMDGLYVDGDTLYLAEGWDGDRIFKVEPNGDVSTFASGLDGPIDIVRREDGTFYVSEWNAARISQIDGGTVSIYATVAAGPGPMTIDEDETIYVTHNVNDGSGSITTIDVLGNVSVLAEEGLLINPGGIDFASDGNLYVANFNNGNILRIEADTTITVLATIPSDGFWKTGHLKAKGDSLFVSGIGDHNVYLVELDGSVNVFSGTGAAGHLGGTLSEAEFNNPNGMGFNESNSKLFVAKAFGAADYIQQINWGVSSLTKNEEVNIFEVFPNPASNILNVLAHNQEVYEVQLMNLAGELLLSTTDLQIDISGLNKGTYFIVLQTSSGQESSLFVKN